MFSRVSVCPQWEGGMHGTHAPPHAHLPPGMHAPRHSPLKHAHPQARTRTPPTCTHIPQACMPPWQILRDARDERVVRILLECIHVGFK